MLGVGNSVDGRIPLETSAAGQVIPPVTLSDGSRGAAQFSEPDSTGVTRVAGEVVAERATTLNVSDELLLSPRPRHEEENPFIVLVRHRFGSDIDV